MKLVFSSGGMRRLERAACEALGCTLKEMMENAGAAAVRLLQRKDEAEGRRIAVVCGKGNNGGDGFVSARLLDRLGAVVTVILSEGAPSADLAGEAFSALPASVPVIRFEENREFASDVILSADWIFDGLFGFGFHGKAEGIAAELIELINRSGGRTISLDIPSGLPCDTGAAEGPCVCADYTVSFSALKPAHVLQAGKRFCGEVSVASVGIPTSFIETFPGGMNALEYEEACALLPLRRPDGHKGTFGSALCVCGSIGMAGAAVMSVSAALRTGVGLVIAAASEALYPLLVSHLTEPVFVLYGEDLSPVENALKKASAVLIGCGCGRSETALALLKTVLRGASCPCILDADALNLIAEQPDLLSLRAPGVPLVMTPHPAELARLMHTDTVLINRDRPKAALEAAKRFSAYVVLKGSGTVIASPEGRLWINVTGNDGMAKGGSGDVLAGMLVSLAAQGMPVEEACAVGVYFHGLAGDECARALSRRAMLPTDLIGTLPQVFKAAEK